MTSATATADSLSVVTGAAVRRLAILAAVLACAVAAFRTCNGPGAGRGAGGAEVGDPESPAEAGRGAGDSGSPSAAHAGRPKRPTRKRAGEAGDAGVDPAEETTPAWEPFVRVKWPDGTPAAGAVAMLGDLDGGDGGTGLAEDEPGSFPSDEFVMYWHISAGAVRDGEAWVGREAADGPAVGTITLRRADEWEVPTFVRVEGPTGEPVRFAVVAVVRGTPRWGFENERGSGFSISGGRFAFQPWRWRVEADDVLLMVHSAVGDDGVSFGPALVAFGPLPPLERAIRLPPGGAVRGRVLDAAGTPVVGADVELDPPRPDGFDDDHMTMPRLTERTGDDGAFVFHGLGRGTARLRVSTDLCAAAPLDAEVGGNPVAVTLDTTTFRCGVRVLGPEGTVLASAKVTPRWPVERKWAQSFEEGTHWIEVGRGVPIDVTVDAPDCIPARIAAWRPEPAEVRTVKLHAWTVTTGRVLGPDGAPVEWAPLAVYDAHGQDVPGARVEWLGAEFVVTGVPAGRELSLVVWDGLRNVAVAEAHSGDTSVELRWPGDAGRLVLLRGADDLRPLAVRILADGREIAARAWHVRAIAFESAGWPDVVDVEILDRDGGLPSVPVAGRAPRLTLARSVPKSGLHRVWPAATDLVRVEFRLVRSDDAAPGPVEAVLSHACGASVAGDTDRLGVIEFDLPVGETFTGTATDLTGRWTATFEVPVRGEDLTIRLAPR